MSPSQPESQNSGLFNSLSPKAALVLGLVGGIMALCTIGFFILLNMFLKGTMPTQKAAQAPTVAVDQGNAGSDGAAAQQNNQTAAVNVDVGHFPMLGKSSAPVTVIEFADFRCPFCERFYSDAEKSVIKDYVNTGKVKFYFRGFAFLGPASTLASEAAECANEQGKFWQFHDWMYDHQAPETDTTYYSNDNLVKYAANLGLNKTKFASCLQSNKYSANVTKDLNEGQQAGVNGTPTTFVNGTPIVGAQPYSVVKAAIEAALAKKQ